ncbi:hypothetical protein TRVL_08118 [Trypanosoma vivax]|nr:hypothetical protein TRVL_08118 [Trypanosoma vivax]
MRAWHLAIFKDPAHLVPHLPLFTSDDVGDPLRLRLWLCVSLLSCLVCRLVTWHTAVRKHELEVDGQAEPHSVQYEVPDAPQHRALHHCRTSTQRHRQRH